MDKINLIEHMEIVPDWAPSDPRGTFLAGALVGEAGELNNIFKKEWRDGHGVERKAAMVKELGDVAAYALMLAHHLGVDLMQIAEASFLEFESRPQYKKLLKRVRLFRQYHGGKP
jgi:NTP pyrophosphatase (non-canonical NTP hydrolase)